MSSILKYVTDTAKSVSEKLMSSLVSSPSTRAMTRSYTEGCVDHIEIVGPLDGLVGLEEEKEEVQQIAGERRRWSC